MHGPWERSLAGAVCMGSRISSRPWTRTGARTKFLSHPFKKDDMNRTVRDNPEKKRFELELEEGKIAFIDYIINRKGQIFLTHTEVPPDVRERGNASRMLEQVLQIIEERELNLIPICPFVKWYLRQNPEWQRLLDEEYRGKQAR